MAQIVQNAPAMQETQVSSLGWENLLETRTATHSSVLAQRNSKDRGAWLAIVHEVEKSQAQLSD